MIRKYIISLCLTLGGLSCIFEFQPVLLAQTAGQTIKGLIKESGSGLPLKQVSVFVSSTGLSSETNELGEFSLEVPDLQTEIIVNLPGYDMRNIFLNGRDNITIFLVPSQFKSLDKTYNTPWGPGYEKDAVFPVTSLSTSNLKVSKTPSFDQVLQGRIPGLSVVDQSGMPGQRTFMHLRGFSSLFANSEPLLVIDGMIHDYSYAQHSLMEGFALNPMDVVDLEDITDITVIRDGLSLMGAIGGNGLININTEQKSEASTVIKFAGYGGITVAPEKLDVLDATQYRTYFEEMLNAQGYGQAEINSMYPWLNDNTDPEYYKYSNNTDWQAEILSPANLSKYYFFLKGGDDIATYNISTGYQAQQGIYDASKYSRFNLRINGKINITDKISVTPNAKLSLADSKLANHGPSAWKNPLLAAVLNPPIMAPNARDAATGTELNYLDDVGVFDVSNPVAIVKNAQGSNRNYHFLSSVLAQYTINSHLSLSTMVGINFNNSRENIFLPDIGIIQVDSSYNSPGDFVYEFRSTQNHTMLTYTNKTATGHSFTAQGGFRYMVNSYKYNLSRDVNTPSDYFKSLGDGSQYSFLRSTVGDNRGLAWVSFYGNLNYNFRNKYFLQANLSYDGNSATNEANRYNIYPAVGAAWRLSSESFLNSMTWLEDLKLRGSYSVSGNMYSTVYDYSKLYYTTRRMNGDGVLLREIIPNEDMPLEKKNTINGGLDLSLFRQLINIHADVYTSKVDNLVIQQQLPATFGFTKYYNNGGKLAIAGMELSLDTRIQAGEFSWILGGTIGKEKETIESLTFLEPNTTSVITNIKGAQFITSVNNPLNAYYGYKTQGLVQAGEAGVITGPKGELLQEGDVRFVDVDGNNIINDADKMIIGDPNPDLFGGIFTSFGFKNIELSATFTYSMGNDAFNYVRYKMESMDSYNNQSVNVLERWTPSNTGATLPRALFGDPVGNTVFSDRWIEDASYLRLKQLSLSYSFPALPGIYKGITLYATATNLLTFTKYTGYDPEFMYVNSPFYMGVDYGKMPQSKSFILGLKLDL